MEEMEIMDVENYSSRKDEQFSHQILVMNCMKRCIEAGSEEMRSGYVNQKMDTRGNVITQYIQDTRMKFIATVETCECIIVCDIDTEARKNIKEIKKRLKGKYQDLCELEKKEWGELSLRFKQERINSEIIFMEGYLCKKLQYYQEYLNESVKEFRNILKEFTRLTQRLKFYEAERYEG